MCACARAYVCVCVRSDLAQDMERKEDAHNRDFYIQEYTTKVNALGDKLPGDATSSGLAYISIAQALYRSSCTTRPKLDKCLAIGCNRLQNTIGPWCCVRCEGRQRAEEPNVSIHTLTCNRRWTALGPAWEVCTRSFYTETPVTPTAPPSSSTSSTDP